MESEPLLEAVERENRALARAAEGNLARQVPGCPGWDVAQLVRHLGAVHRWAAGIVREHVEARPQRHNEPSEPADEVLLPWFLEGLEELLRTFRSVDPEKPCWTWTGQAPPQWWRRRQALEAAVHRVDVEQATGTSHPIVEGELSVTGVDEMLDIFIPWQRLPEELGPVGRTLHLHATDREGEWMLRLRAGGIDVERGHAKGDAALRGPASDLFLFLWNRIEVGALELFGDPAVPEIYVRHARRD